MSRTSRVTGFAAVVVVGLVLVGPGATNSAALAQEQAAIPARQSDNERLREVAKPGLRWFALSKADLVPPEEREALGVDDTGRTGQYGKVHPDVYKALDKAESVKEPWLDITGHAGTVYVQVHLRHQQSDRPGSPENKAAIKALGSKVLSQLTAAEFYVEYPFQTLPGILGYATRTGIEKLKTNPDVVAVCLDDKPFPERPQAVTKADLPPPEAGEPATQPAQGRFWGSGGKVAAEVYRALGLYERVDVIVIMQDRPAEECLEKEIGRGRAIEEPVLGSLTAEEFWVRGRAPIGSAHGLFLDGRLTSAALRKLEDHAHVRAVGLPGPPIPAPQIRKPAR